MFARYFSDKECQLRMAGEDSFFFFYEKPSVFAICKNTFSKWKVVVRRICAHKKEQVK
jgi:hypothetical protein